MGTSETLRSVMDAGRTGKRLDELTTARLIGKAAERLHAAQQLAGPGKAVGPVTPAAIAIAADGTVTLELDKKASALAYSAPEQLNGGAGDRRSDVFSLGCVMWEALTHQRLFEAMNEAAVKLAVSEREIKSPSEINANIPAELSAMCMKALSRTGADRYGSAKAMGVEIEEFLSEAGYDDTNEKIAAYLTGMKKAPPPKASTLPPPSILKAEKASAQAEPIKLPSLTPGAPERAAAAMAVAPTSPSGNDLAKKLSSAETKPVEAAPSAEPLVAKPTTPAPPILPTILTEKPTAPSSPAAISDAAATQPAAPSSIAASLPPIESVAAFAPNATDAATQPLLPQPQNLRATISAAVPPPPALLGTAGTAGATIPDGAPVVRESPVTPPPSDPAAPERTNAEGSARHAANPVDAVSLPKRSHRDSEQVLNKWAWQTDSHDAIVEDEDFHAPPSRKPLYYAMGAGCAVAAIVVIIALASGGSSTAKKPAPTAAKESTEPAPAAAPAPTPAPEPAPAPTPAGSDTASAAPPAVAAPEPPKQEPPPPEPPKQAPPPPEPPKQVAKAEPPKQAPPKQAPPKQEPPKQAPPKQVAKADPPKQAPPKQEPPKAAPKTDTETAYKQGLQQFARGDTQGALSSLRTSLAGNPNYPPTWRGLGLVFEKLGEKDQARAAFKRYLQLAPGASDSEQIKTRMEKLGS